MNPGIAIQVDMICGEFQMTLEALATDPPSFGLARRHVNAAMKKIDDLEATMPQPEPKPKQIDLQV